MPFTADLRRFSAITKTRLQKIVGESVTQLLGQMQRKSLGVTAGGALIPGHIPFVTEELVNSLVSRTGVSTFRGERSYAYAGEFYELGDDLVFFWDVPYSRYIEDGDEWFVGWHYVKTNAPDWPSIVVQNARRIRNRYR